MKFSFQKISSEGKMRKYIVADAEVIIQILKQTKYWVSPCQFAKVITIMKQRPD